MPAGGFSAPGGQGMVPGGYGQQYPQFYPGQGGQPGYPGGYGAYGGYPGATPGGAPQPAPPSSDKN